MPEVAARVVAPPIAMLAPEQWDEGASLDPISFRHVIGPGVALSDPSERGKRLGAAADWLRERLADGTFEHHPGPMAFVYEIQKQEHRKIGIVANVSVAAYRDGRVRKHEDTLEETEAGLAEHMDRVRANGSPVALAHTPSGPIASVLARHSSGPPALDFVAGDGCAHSLWPVTGPDDVAELMGLYGELPALYITDGHHRSAAAARFADQRRSDGEGEGPHDGYLAALFSSDQLRLRAFGRYVSDRAEMSAREFLALLSERFIVEQVEEVEHARPSGRGQFGMITGGSAYRITILAELIPDDAYQALDVIVLRENALSLLGVTDGDPRLHYVPDLAEPADDGVSFLPYPTSVADVIAVADAGRVMPPKSTWFEPKLPTGLVTTLL